jgi:hypothetical protein
MNAENGAVVPQRSVGFDARLSGASLWDLVQMECQARVRRVFQVIGEGGVGYLFLSGGRVVHAATAHLAGEPAALEILSWANGSFRPCERSWPAAESVQSSIEAMILEVARRRDEQGASKLLAFPGRAAGEDGGQEEIELLEIEEEGKADMRTTTTIEQPPVAPGTRSDAGPDFPVMLRLASNGAIVKNNGGSEELAEAIAYAQRLVQLTGELLGLDPFVAMECVSTTGRTFVFAEAEGDVVALRPKAEVNLNPLRERLGL